MADPQGDRKKELEDLVTQMIEAKVPDDEVQKFIDEFGGGEPSTGDNIREGLKWAGKVVTGAMGMNAPDRGGVSPGSDLMTSADEHPYITGASLAVPGIIGVAGKAAAPYVAPGIRAAGEVLEQPAVGGAVGALEGYRRNGWEGALYGGAGGIVGGSVLGKLLKAKAALMGSVEEAATAAPGARVVAGTPKVPIEASLQEAMEELMRGGGKTLPTPAHPRGGSFTVPEPVSPNVGGRLVGRPAAPTSAEDEFAAMLKEGQAPTRTDLPLSHSEGGGFTVPVEDSALPVRARANQGGRLGGVPTKEPTLEEIIRQALEEARATPNTGTSIPESGSPSVTLSPKAQAAAREGTPSKKGPKAEPAKASDKPSKTKKADAPVDTSNPRFDEVEKRRIMFGGVSVNNPTRPFPRSLLSTTGKTVGVEYDPSNLERMRDLMAAMLKKR